MMTLTALGCFAAAFIMFCLTLWLFRNGNRAEAAGALAQSFGYIFLAAWSIFERMGGTVANRRLSVTFWIVGIGLFIGGFLTMRNVWRSRRKQSK